ncbi:hypothetical protein HDU76_010378 [Blyttiomyces sp. JEL0837]|nr:hypothetical protein HDU76_010378 [Blyttiomyces sp. JEL0837]
MSLPSATSPPVMTDNAFVNKEHIFPPETLAKIQEFKAKMQAANKNKKVNVGVITADQIVAWEKAGKLLNMSSEDMLNMTSRSLFMAIVRVVGAGDKMLGPMLKQVMLYHEFSNNRREAEAREACRLKAMAEAKLMALLNAKYPQHPLQVGDIL